MQMAQRNAMENGQIPQDKIPLDKVPLGQNPPAKGHR